MTGIVDIEHPHETIFTQFKSRDAAVPTRDPDGLELGGVEGAHEMKGQDADRSGVAENHDASAAIRGNDLVEFVSRAIEKLTITFAAGENVFEVATEKGSVLLGMLLRGVFESETFHHSDTAFAKCFGGVDAQTRQSSERLGRRDGAREIARIDCRYRVIF